VSHITVVAIASKAPLSAVSREDRHLDAIDNDLSGSEITIGVAKAGASIPIPEFGGGPCTMVGW
jgi:hypothetical protein